MGALVSFLSEIITAISTEGLDTLLAGSEFDVVHYGSLEKCAIGCATLEIDWDAAIAEAEYRHKVFCLYNYDAGRAYGCNEQVEYVSVRDSRSYRWYDMCLRASAMT